MTKNTRVAEIDLLRFLAALSVVLFHYGFRGFAADGLSDVAYEALAPFACYGYLGVELFFMISGFVILMTASGGGLKAFVTSRVARLYPAYWACCTLTFLACLAWGGDRFPVSWGQYLANMTMLNGYFGVPHIDGAYWSLMVEMNFYALVALVLLAGRIHQAERFFWGWLAIAVALQVVPSWRLQLIFSANYTGFFVAGATFYLIWLHGLTAGRVALVLASWLLALHTAARDLDRLQAHYAQALSLPVVLAVVSLCFAVLALVALRRTGFVGRRDWRTLGALTYPLYLLHENIGFMALNAAPAWLDKYLLLALVLAGALAAAWAVHVLVERPLARPVKRAAAALLERLQRAASPALARLAPRGR